MSIKRRVFILSVMTVVIPLLICSGLFVLLQSSWNLLGESNSEEAFALRQMVLMNRNFIMIGIGAVIAVSLVLILASFAFSYILTKDILGGLRRIKDAAEEIKSGNLDIRIETNGSDEFSEVLQEFNSMAARLKETIIENLRFQEDNKTLMAGITHDLKTPMTSIKGYLEGVIDGVADTDEKRARYLNTAKTKVDEMNQLIDELFLASKLDLRKVPVKMERLELSAFVREFFEEQRRSLYGDCELLFNDAAKNSSVMADRLGLQRTLSNLVDNCRKYRSSEPLEISFEVKENARNIILKLSDNGQGVRAEDLEHIFKSFYRGDKARSDPQNGSGLGLSIARSTIEDMKGRIWARNNEPHGLSVYISFEKAEAKS